jgi:putative CRISPR-associated protein (TIGR02619 family)
MNPNPKLQKIILTAGISLFLERNGLRKLLAQSSDHGLAWPNKGPTPKPAQGLDETKALAAWKTATDPHVRTLVSSGWQEEAERLSAEVSILSVLEKKGRLVKSPEICLIGTQTFGGQTACSFLEAFISKRFKARVRVKLIPDFDVKDPQKIRQSLGEYLNLLYEELKNQDRSTTCFAPIGGYKIMTAYANVIATLFKIHCAYLHESSPTLLMIPPLPFSPDVEAFQNLRPLLKKIGNGIEFKKLTPHEQQLAQDHSYLFEWTEDLLALHVLTSSLLEHVGKTINTRAPVYFDKRANKTWRKLDSKTQDFVLQQTRSLQDKLSKASTDLDLFHHLKFSTRHPNSLRLYKGPSNSSLIFRLAYMLPPTQEGLFVSQFWTNHDSYDQEITELLKKPQPDLKTALRWERMEWEEQDQ